MVHCLNADATQFRFSMGGRQCFDNLLSTEWRPRDPGEHVCPAGALSCLGAESAVSEAFTYDMRQEVGSGRSNVHGTLGESKMNRRTYRDPDC